MQGLQSPSLNFTEDTLNDNYVSSEDMLRDVRDYTAALHFNINIPADRGDLHTESSRGLVSPYGGAMPEESVPSSLPLSYLIPTPTSALAFVPISAPAPATPRASTGRISRYLPPRGVTPAVTRSKATRQNRTPALTGNQGNSSNVSAAIAKCVQPDTPSHLHEMRLCSSEAHDNVHQIDN